MKSLFIKDIATMAEQEVHLYGWVRTRRAVHKKLVFLDLWDRSGLCQIVLITSQLDEESQKISGEIRQGYCLEIIGKVKSRAENQINANLPTGTVEVVAKTIKIMNASKPLPFDLDDQNVAEEARLRYRYLDLRSVRMMENLKLRSLVSNSFRQFLLSKNFLEVETPCLTKGTPEGSREYTVPSRIHSGKSYVLPQSPQQFKQLLMVAGVERYFQIARCFRDEDQRKDRQPEFTQLDLEMSFVDEKDIQFIIEEMIFRTFGNLYINHPSPDMDAKFNSLFIAGEPAPPWPRITYQESIERYGSDKPDLRKNKEDPNEMAFVWITDFPMFEKGQDGSIQSSHHPFTAPKEEDIDLLDSEPLKVRAKAYDLVLNGNELLSGSIRIHQRDLQNKVFGILGLKEEEITERFGHMLEAFEFGAPIHGGGALGLDRFLMLLSNESNIREVITFPKTGDAKDLLMCAPS